MKKRWIIIIVVVLLLASFTIYQFVNSNSTPVIDMMQAQMAPSNPSIARAPTQHALGLDVPVYVQVFRNASVPAPQNYPAASNPAANSNSSNINTTPTTVQVMNLQSSSTFGQPMIVRTAVLSMVVTDITTAVSQITQLTNNNNGYVVLANQTSTDKLISGDISIRIPAVQFESTMIGLRAMAVKVTSEIVSASDASQEYTDLSSKLRNLETAAAQLTQIMQKAEKVEDVLAVENQLISTQGEIEVTKGRIQYLEQTSATSVININLQQSTLIVSLYAGTSYARTKDNIGFSVEISREASVLSAINGTLAMAQKVWTQHRGINTMQLAIIP